jgi:predicted membrane chloride channel (bestrophin family)
LLGQHLRRRLARSVLAMRAVLSSVLALGFALLQRCEVAEDLVRSLVSFAVIGHEQRDLVLAFPILLPRRDLLRDEVEAELRQPLAHRRRVRAPLGLVQREHTAMLVGARSG